PGEVDAPAQEHQLAVAPVGLAPLGPEHVREGVDDVAAEGALGLADHGEVAGGPGADVAEPGEEAADGLGGPDAALPEVGAPGGELDGAALLADEGLDHPSRRC